MKSSLDQVLKWITADDTTLNTYFTHGAERSSIRRDHIKQETTFLPWRYMDWYKFLVPVMYRWINIWQSMLPAKTGHQSFTRNLDIILISDTSSPYLINTFFFMQLWVYLAILSIYGDFKYFWQFWVFFCDFEYFWRFWVFLAILSIFWRFWVFFTILSIFYYFEQLVWLECSFQALSMGTTHIWF